ncbi:hypothetical protein M405DRAFT_848111 [Rhizopogon salebrosus TDB-379]|nr:hypothetical protein M405DRAFT_848111 [Rhizopogon salebrosus TDB-379]
MAVLSGIGWLQLAQCCMWATSLMLNWKWNTLIEDVGHILDAQLAMGQCELLVTIIHNTGNMSGAANKNTLMEVALVDLGVVVWGWQQLASLPLYGPWGTQKNIGDRMVLHATATSSLPRTPPVTTKVEPESVPLQNH